MNAQTQELAKSIMGELDRMIAEAPEQSREEACKTARRLAICTTQRNHIYETCGVPGKYREEWPLPTDEGWQKRHESICRMIEAGGIICLVGPRGSGKTRHAVEALRAKRRHGSKYTTAMGLFIRLKSTYSHATTETEGHVVEQLGKCPLLLVDEIQERGDSAWEDRVLAHLIDLRYGEELPTILIANTTATELAKSLGESIVSRITENGGIITVDGPSHRKPKTDKP